MSAWLWHYRVLVARHGRTGAAFTYDTATSAFTHTVVMNEAFVPWCEFYRIAETRE